MSDSIKSLINGLAEQVNKGLHDMQVRMDEIEKETGERKTGYNHEELEKRFKDLDMLENQVQELKVAQKTSIPLQGASPAQRKFSLVKAIRGLSTGIWEADGVERNSMKLRQYDGSTVEGKALIDETGSSGGHYLIPDEFSTELITLLKSRSVFGSLPCMRISPMGGTFRIPKMSTGATAYVVGSSAAITASNPTFTQVNMTPWKIGTLVPIANELIRRSDPAAAQIVQQDCTEALQLKADQLYISGAGTTEPTGLLNTASINSIAMGVGDITTNGGTLLDSGQQDQVMNMIKEVENDNAIFEAFLFNTRTKWDLRTMKDANNNYLLTVQNNMGDLPTLYGYPYFVSNQIPNNITTGGSTDTTYILGGQFSKVVIATWTNIMMSVSDQAAWVTSGPVTHSAFQDDVTLIRMIMETDILLRNADAICKLTGLRPNSEVTPAE